MHNQSKTFLKHYNILGDLCIRRHSVWEESMIDMLREILTKAETGNKAAEDKLIDGIIQAKRDISNLSCLSYELQDTIKEATDWLATKGVNIQSDLNSGKDINV
jgi:hypothetical protein